MFINGDIYMEEADLLGYKDDLEYIAATENIDPDKVDVIYAMMDLIDEIIDNKY